MAATFYPVCDIVFNVDGRLVACGHTKFPIKIVKRLIAQYQKGIQRGGKLKVGLDSRKS
ncbi:MAG: hypothetical protein IPG23_16550 [Burkholderiales bacterium]|nr:hypothetical protein [Burkholderiales bacterium]